MVVEANKNNSKVSNPKQDTKNITKSPSKPKNKLQTDDKNENQKHQLSTDSEKDLR